MIGSQEQGRTHTFAQTRFHKFLRPVPLPTNLKKETQTKITQSLPRQ